MIGYCAHCGEKFKSWKRKTKYCSVKCDRSRRRKVDVERLRQLAFTGATKAAIARELGVGYATVWKAMREFGINEMWKEQRYA